mgnify:CR=1 FL=1
MIILVFLQIHFSYCEFFGTYDAKIQNWNRGRIYFGDNYGRGVSTYGPVCKG